MAPALTEPLSPTEKLSKKSIAPTVPKTRSSRRGNSLSSTFQANIPVAVTTRDHKIRRSNTPTISNIQQEGGEQTIRKTRSKEYSYQHRILEKPSSIVVPINSTSNKNKSSKTSKEQMGLTTALSTNNNTNKINNSKNNSNTKSNNNNSQTRTIKGESTLGNESTQEILANLTINFEEAISAEICLRKQLLDSNLNKEVAKNTNGTELKDILVIKSGGSTLPEDCEVLPIEQLDQKQHMEPELGAAGKTLDAIDNKLTPTNVVLSISNSEITNTTLIPEIAAKQKEGKDHVEDLDKNESVNISSKRLENQIESVTENQNLCEIATSSLKDEQDRSVAATKTTGNVTHVKYFDVNTVSAINEGTEVEEVPDNLEERLSQLDGQVQTIEPELCDSVSELTEINRQTVTAINDGAEEEAVELHELQAQLQEESPRQEVQLHQKEQQSPQQQQPQHHHHQQQQQSTNISTGGELEDQDLEEVLRALKGFDPSTASADALCDLNALFGEVYQNMNYEDTNTVQTNNTIACSTSPLKSTPLQETQLEIERGQQAIQRKLDFLVLRLRKLQARHMCKHASEEIAGIFEHTVRAVNNKVRDNSLLDVTGQADNDTLAPKPVAGMSLISARPLADVWQEERECPVSTAEVCSLLRKLESTAKAQQLSTVTTNANVCHNQVRKSRKTSAATDSTQTATPVESAVMPATTAVPEHAVPPLDNLVVEEMYQVAGLLRSEMREVQLAIDSDATESSSGCESADEMISYNNQIQQPLSISKRAAWRYARERAALAARWSWLLAQKTDLDIKIRQSTELYNEIVRQKGSVINDTAIIEDDENDTSTSCRTHGYLSKNFRKRKLLQTTNIHTISKKAARPSTIKCGCQWPLQPCALCTGRVDPTAPRELPNTMTKSERVALLDSGFHHVLSFPEDISSSLPFEAIARLSDWQQRVMRCQVKSIAKSVWKAEREATNKSGNSGRKYDSNGVKRRYIKKKDRLAAETGGSNMTAIKDAADVSRTGADNGDTAAGFGAEHNGIQSATSTTPLVANKKDKQHCQSLLDRRTTTTTTITAATGMEMMDTDANFRRTSDYPVQKKLERYNNRKPTMISRKNNNRYHHNRNRKAFSSSSSSSSFSAFVTHRQQQQQQTNNQYQFYNNSSSTNNNYNQQPQQQHAHSQYHNSNGNSSSSETAHNNLHMHDNWDYVTGMASRMSSPIHASSGYHRHERSERKRSSYDIDNIVIPYSVAAATRVEIIPYKEIPTPKWRVIDTNNGDEESDTEGNEQKAKENADQSTIVNEKSENSDECRVENSKNEDTLVTEVIPSTAVDLESVILASQEKLGEVTLKPEPTEQNTLTNETEITEEIKSKSEILVRTEKSEDLMPKSEPTDQEITSTQKIEIVESSKKNCKNEEDENNLKGLEGLHNTELKECAIKSETNIVENNLMKNTKNVEEHFEEFKEMKECKFIEKSLDESEEKSDDTQVNMETETAEDITDAVMAMRHERALTEERRKFQTYLKFPWTTRSRANRRGDSRAESSGANTPDPTSPAPHAATIGGVDQESISSPSAATLSTPSTPFTPMECPTSDTIHETFAAYDYNSRNRKRCRTTSSKKEHERRSPTPDNREFILPYEPLKFPLSDDAFNEMQDLMPTYNRRIESKQDAGSNSCSNRKPIGSYGRGRNGLRRQAVNNTNTTLARSIRPRLSNRPYVLDSNKSGVTEFKETIQGEDGFEEPVERVGKFFVTDKNNTGAPNAEETEDETETCTNEKSAKVNAKYDLFTEEDEDEDDDEEEDELDDLDDDEDDGFPKHPLATADDVLDETKINGDIHVVEEDDEEDGEQSEQQRQRRLAEDDDDDYVAYMGHDELFMDRDLDFSDAEPFQDDDPNDPEWNGERVRKRM